MDYKKEEEVVDFVNKPSLYALVGVLEEQFNYKIDFAEMRENELIEFIKDLLNGNTEYCLDDKFPKQTFIDFKSISWLVNISNPSAMVDFIMFNNYGERNDR